MFSGIFLCKHTLFFTDWRFQDCLFFRFSAINAGLVYVYFNNFQKVEEEEYGGVWEITKEGFMTSFASFLVRKLIVNLKAITVKPRYNMILHTVRLGVFPKMLEQKAHYTSLITEHGVHCCHTGATPPFDNVIMSSQNFESFIYTALHLSNLTPPFSLTTCHTQDQWAPFVNS